MEEIFSHWSEHCWVLLSQGAICFSGDFKNEVWNYILQFWTFCLKEWKGDSLVIKITFSLPFINNFFLLLCNGNKETGQENFKMCMIRSKDSFEADHDTYTNHFGLAVDLIWLVHTTSQFSKFLKINQTIFRALVVISFAVGDRVYTKLVDSVFCMLWLAIQAQDSICYSPPGMFLDIAHKFCLSFSERRNYLVQVIHWFGRY